MHRNGDIANINSENIDNGNVGDNIHYDNNNHEQEEEEDGNGDGVSCLTREDHPSRNGSQVSPAVANSKLPVYRVVKGIKNSNQLFNYRFSPV